MDSRLHRRQQKLKKAGLNHTNKITDYFNLEKQINEISSNFKTISKINKKVDLNLKKALENQNVSITTFLNDLLTTAKNSTFQKSPHSIRYEDRIKEFALYIFLIGGRCLYQTLSNNLPLPKVNNVLK